MSPTNKPPANKPPANKPRANKGLPEQLEQLLQHHGAPKRPLPKKALDWILWENAAYLVPDDKRERAYKALKKATRLRSDGILALPREDLQQLASLGGMMPDRRVSKWIAIAEIVEDQFGGDLESALKLPLSKARSALKKFPGIGAPGADKILLFTGTHALAALESNGLRVLIRLGHADEAKNYSTSYRRATKVLDAQAEQDNSSLKLAYQLLREHGQSICKNNDPHCDECPLARACPSASD